MATLGASETRGTLIHKRILVLLAALSFAILVLPLNAKQPDPLTTTTLSVSPPSPVVAGQVVTLTATVTFGGNPVTVGTVSFLSGTQVLGTVQVVKVSGTATLKLRFAPGMYSLIAQYNGTNAFPPSQSAAQPYTVTGTEATITTLTDQRDMGNPNNYDFTASVFGFGFPALTGTASFTDLTTMTNLGIVGIAGPGMWTFQPEHTYQVGSNSPLGVAIGDFNGDGFPDLAVTSDEAMGTVSVLLGNGDGTFKTQQQYPVGSESLEVVIGDFNGDGILDLAVTNLGGGTVSVLLGIGNGAFQPQQTIPVGNSPFGIAVADFNGDGIADLAVTNQQDSTVRVLLGDGHGAFQPQPAIALGQFRFPADIAVADFNGDGILDLAVTTQNPATVMVLLGNGDGNFKKPQQYPVRNEPYGVAVGDFNGDGIPDLAVANLASDLVSVLLGNGDGTFQAQQTYPVGSEPLGIAVGDFNGDGIADLAVGNSHDLAVSVLLGKGDGTFQAQQTFDVNSSFQVAVGDLNGDGVPDLAVSTGFATTVSVFIGGTVTTGQLKNVPVFGVGDQKIQSTYTPDGNFYAGSMSNTVTVAGNGQKIPTNTTVSSSQNPSSYLQPVTFTATVTDDGGSPTGTVEFLADGKDIPGCSAVQLVPIQNGSSATCMIATLLPGGHKVFASYSGDSNFSPSQSPTIVQSVNAAATTTVLTAVPPSPSNFGQPVTFTATVTGAFGGSPTGTVDFTDNQTPIAGCTGVQLAPQQNGSAATCTTASLSIGSHTIAGNYSGDMEGTFSPSSGSILYNVAEATATTLTVSPPSPVMTGQVVTLTATVTSNGDPVSVGTATFLNGQQVLGTVQLVQTTGTATLKVRFAPGTYSLTAHFNGTNSLAASQSAAQPYDVTGTEPTITTLTFQPDGNNYDFTDSIFGFGFPAPIGSASFTDLTTMINLGSVGIVGPGMSSFQPQQIYPVGDQSTGVAVADFNGDGFPDLVITDDLDFTVRVLLGKGDGTFQPQQIYPAGRGGAYEVAVSDFNGDGIADLAVTNDAPAISTVSVLLGNGDGTFQPPQTYPVGLAPYGVATADLNGDGIADLAIANELGNTVSVLLGNGDGTFQPQQTYQVAKGNTIGIAVADFNGDGFADLATTNFVDNTVSVLLGNGDGTFQPQQTHPVGHGPWGVATADFNGDGFADLATTNFGEDTVSVLLGNGDGTFHPQQTYKVSFVPRGLTTADFNGDGIADLASANSGDTTVSVLLGKGDGTFQPEQIYSVGNGPYSIGTGDFNGDGVPDLATPNIGLGNGVSILLGGTVTTGLLKNVPVFGVGDQKIQSTYTPDGNFYAGSMSNTVTVAGNGQKLPTATAVSSSQNPSSYLQAVTFTANVTDDGGSPTGTVTFTADGNVICAAVPLTPMQNGSTATCMIATLLPGAHSIVATYSGDNNFAPSQSPAFQQNVNKAATTTVLTADPPQSNFGQQVTFTATVTGAFGGSPTGTVDFTGDNMPIAGCTGVALVAQQNGSTATCQTASLLEGAHTIAATYNGDNHFSLSSGSILYNVGSATTTTLSVAPPPPVAAGQAVTLTATVTSNGFGIGLGTVTFSDGQVVLGTVQLVQFPPPKKGGAPAAPGTATLKTRFAPGIHSLTAQFNHTNEFETSTSAAQPYTVTGTEPTISTLSATPDGNNYDFALSVFGFGFPPLSGNATLNNLTQGGSLLGNIGLAGPGASTFQAQALFNVGTEPRALTTGDFNSDGISDLAVSNTLDGNVSVLLGNGDGSFQAQKTYAVGPLPLQNGIAAGDFNGDGNLDLAVEFVGDQGGLTAGVSVLLGNGDGTFQPKKVYSVQFAAMLAVGDLNGDGAPDLAVATTSSAVVVLLNNGNGTFTVEQQTFPAATVPFEIAVGDFNGDGKLDLAEADYLNKQAVVLLGNGDGTFQPAQTFPAGQNPDAIAVGDLNGDGKLDLVLSNQTDNTVSVLLGNGDGTFQAQQVVNVGLSPSGIVIADVNGDGIADLSVTNGGDNTLGVLLGNGDGTFRAQQTYQAGTGPVGVAAADFNGDGVPDLATANTASNDVSILLGGTVTTGQLLNIPVCGVGNQNIQSTYAPNGNFYAGSPSNIVNVNVNGCGPRPTATALTSSLNPSEVNQPVTFTATVTARGQLPTGNVTFTSNGSPIPECPNPVPVVQAGNGSVATCTSTSLAVGSDVILATFNDPSGIYGDSSDMLQQTVQDFSLLASTAVVSVTQSFNNTNQPYFSQPISLTAQALSGSGGTVTLSCSVKPALVNGSCTVNPPNSGSLANGSLNTTLTINTDLSTAIGSYVVTVTAQEQGGLMHFTTLALTVINYTPVITMVPDGTGQTPVVFPGPPGTKVGGLSCPLITGTGITGSQNPTMLGITCGFTMDPVTLPNPVALGIRGCIVNSRLTTPMRILASFWLAMPVMVLLGSMRGRKLPRKNVLRVVATLLLLLALLMGVGCGGGSTSSGGSTKLPPPGSYSLLVQGRDSGGTVYSAVVPVSVGQ